MARPRTAPQGVISWIRHPPGPVVAIGREVCQSGCARWVPAAAVAAGPSVQQREVVLYWPSPGRAWTRQRAQLRRRRNHERARNGPDSTPNLVAQPVESGGEQRTHCPFGSRDQGRAGRRTRATALRGRTRPLYSPTRLDEVVRRSGIRRAGRRPEEGGEGGDQSPCAAPAAHRLRQLRA